MPEEFEHQPPSAPVSQPLNPTTPAGHSPMPPPPPQTAPEGFNPNFAAPGSAPPGYPPAGYGRPPVYPGYAAPAYAGAGYPTPGYMGAKPRSAWFWIAIVGGALVLLCIFIGLTLRSTARVLTGASNLKTLSGNGIGVIELTGVIGSAEQVDKQLDAFGDDDSVKAIILHINSPGGGAAASQEIYHDVLRVRQEKHKKIIASVESVGASGAYYIASACDRIYANDASVVGSIGVIIEWTNYGDLMKFIKLKSVVIHAGELKDAGDPSRDLTPKEQAYFQSLVDNMYTQFVHDVALGRHTSDATIRPLATGQVWTGQQSLPLGLIDKVGGFRVALIETAREAGISGEPNIIKPPQPRKGLAALINGDADDLFPNPGKLLDHSPGFYFLWK